MQGLGPAVMTAAQLGSAAGEQPLIQGFGAHDHYITRKPARPLASVSAEFTQSLAVRSRAGNRTGKRRRRDGPSRFGRDQPARLAFLHNFGQTADPAGYYRETVRHRHQG